MRITYVARSFLDYRIPVLVELDKISGRGLHFISSTKWTPERVLKRLTNQLGDRAIFLQGEKSIGVDVPVESNTTVCIPFQPGLLRTIQETEPEVLIGDGFFQWTFAILLHRILRGTPIVICYERWSHTERAAQWYRKLYRRMALKLVSAICCNGKLAADYTASLGFPSEQITTGHMAADTVNLSAQAKTADPEITKSFRKSLNICGILFLCVGRLIKLKGIAWLLDAWKHFELSQEDQGTLVVAGAGPEEASLKNQAQRLRLKNVRFVGAVDYDRIATYYAAADAFIIPTLEDNWSLVVPEAMACGLPILCSKFNGCWPELVQKDRNGWVFDPLEAASTLGCLERALQCKDHLARMGQESRKIIQGHTPASAARSIFEACTWAIKPHPARARKSPQEMAFEK